jgi:hypothetical protein
METALAYFATSSEVATAAELGETVMTASEIASFTSPAWTTGQMLYAGATGLSLLGQVGGAIQRSEAADFNAKMARQKAELALNDAEVAGFRAVQKSKEEALVLRGRQRRAQSARVAEIGASGLDMEGSALRVVEGADFMGENEIQKVLTGGTIAANNSLLRGQRAAAAYTGQAGMDEARSTSELWGGAVGAGGTLLKYGARRNGVGYGSSLSMSELW